MSDVTIKISVDPASGVHGVSSDAGAGPVPTELSAAIGAVETTVDAPGPAAGILEEASEGAAAAANEVGPAPMEPSHLGADVAAEGTAVGEAAPPPEDLEEFAAEADAAAEEEDAPEPMPLASLEAESRAKASPKAKPKRQTKKKA